MSTIKGMVLWKQYLLPGRDNENEPLTYRGDISLIQKPCLAVVGPRDPIAYTLDVTTVVLFTASYYDLVILSWWAEGIDQHAHHLAMKLWLPTICVVWAGLDWMFQSTRWWLLHRIVDTGWLVISQFSPTTSPARWTFPQRNKLIACLSSAIFCPAAWVKSGSMSTIHHGLSVDTPVWSVPWPLRDHSMQGTNQLIEQWAIRMTTIFHDMCGSIAMRSKGKKLIPAERQPIIDMIGTWAKSIQQLQELADIPWMHACLVSLQAQWVICQQHNWKYVVIDP